MKRLFVLSVKYIPTIQLVGMLINNTYKHVRNINREITYWDVYVAVNAQYHDYIRIYKQWFPNLTEEQLDEKIIHSAINFWFEDEDAGSGKVWNYFKDI